MAEHGEWTRKGAVISDVTATKEYGVDRDFIVKGIRAGKIEYREASIWGNPFIKILRRQLEQFIDEELGAEQLRRSQSEAELRKIKKEMADLSKRLKELQLRKSELESAMNDLPITADPPKGTSR